MSEIFDMWMRGMWDLLALARAWVAVITPLCVGVAWILSPLAAAYVVTMVVRARMGTL